MAKSKYNLGKTRQSKTRRKRKAVGAAPGTLMFTGNQKMEESNLSLIRYNETLFEQSTPDVKTFLQPTEDTVSWYDIRGVHDVNLVETFGKAFKMHPLILEDILDTHQRPKFEEYEDSLYMVVKALSFDRANLEIKTEQISLFVRKQLVISFQEDVTETFSPILQRIESGRGRIRKRGGDYLAYALIDTIVDNYYYILDSIEEVIDEMEDEIIAKPNEHTKGTIHLLKREMLTLRRAITPLRDAINKFAKSDHAVIQETSQIFIRDLYDHLIQVMDSVENYRDTLSGLQDLYISEISFKMNNVMQVLTIISTIFIPLSFLAGLYGMNFKFMPELDWHYGYFILLGVMATLAISLLIAFKRRNWM